MYETTGVYVQTGDVLYHEIKEMPKGAKKAKGNVIHQGRDHVHGIKGDCSLYVLGKELFIKARKSCKLIHPEHEAVTLKPSVYVKGIVVEFDHLTEESRQVID